MKGLCVIKKAINQVNSRDLLERFKEEINTNIMNLVHNPYGNYVIQCALDVFEINFLKLFKIN